MSLNTHRLMCAECGSPVHTAHGCPRCGSRTYKEENLFG